MNVDNQNQRRNEEQLKKKDEKCLGIYSDKEQNLDNSLINVKNQEDSNVELILPPTVTKTDWVCYFNLYISLESLSQQGFFEEENEEDKIRVLFFTYQLLEILHRFRFHDLIIPIPFSSEANYLFEQLNQVLQLIVPIKSSIFVSKALIRMFEFKVEEHQEEGMDDCALTAAYGCCTFSLEVHRFLKKVKQRRLTLKFEEAGKEQSCEMYVIYDTFISKMLPTKD